MAGVSGYNPSAPTWTFTSLTPNAALSYDVYVYSATPLTNGWQSGYTANGGPPGTADTTAPSLGPGWYCWGSVPVLASANMVTVHQISGGLPGAVALLQNMSQTAYDPLGEETATIDAMGRVTASAYNALGSQIAQYQGQVIAGSSTVFTWTYDADDEAGSFTSASHADESVGSYSYDSTGQLTGATQPTGVTANASNSLANSYDANGNATSLGSGGTASTTTIGTGNTLLFDGTYNDTYDPNGNLVEQSNSTSEVLNQYDNRNRLTFGHQ